MATSTPTTPDLLERMRDLQLAANRAEMARARTAVLLFQQLSADVEARRAADPRFTATPLSETVTETQPVTGQTVGRIRTEVEQVLLVDHELPWLAPYLDDGRLDLDRVRPVTDALRQDLADHPEARARFGALMWRWFERAAADSPAQLNKTFTQVRNHVHYVVTKVLAGGRADTGAPTTAAGHAFPTGHWSRPVINVTVPIQTLMGLSDEPGRMGETTLPASLVRLVASEPGSTWHRLLTDPARHGVELSTSTYRADRPDLAGGRRHPADVLRADVHPQRHHLRPRPPSPVAAGSDVIRQTSGPLAVGTTAPSMWRARP